MRCPSVAIRRCSSTWASSRPVPVKGPAVTASAITSVALLIGLAVVLFLLEFTVTSHGLLAVGGMICFVLGAFALYTAPGSPPRPMSPWRPR